MADYDTDLMVRVQQGEVGLYRTLFDRHYARAVNTVYHSLGDREQAEDVAMEAFARIYESRTAFRGDAKFSTYLYRVLVNLTINESRRHRTIAVEDVDAVEQSASLRTDDPHEQAEKSRLAAEVRHAILDLPANQRLALVLTRYQGLSYQDAAAAMNTSVGAVESLLHRAKNNLRKLLKEYVE